MIMLARLPAMQILVSIGTVGASPQIGEISPPCDFFWLSCPYLFFSILRPGRTAGPIFMLCGSNDVFSRKDGPFGVRTMGDHIWGKYAPKLPQNGCE